MPSGKLLWKDAAGLAVARLSPSSFGIIFEEIATAVVDVEVRTVALSAMKGDLPPSTFEHLLFDQIFPRIRAYDGEFVVHAAVVKVGDGVVLITGKSGRGKSTLAAALDDLGGTLIGDDAAVVEVVGDRPIASATYPSLRLLPDSLAALYGTKRESWPAAHYTSKRRLVPAQASHADLVPLPCLAVIVISEPKTGENDVCIDVIEPTRLCMELVQESFALDPSDTGRAAGRLQQASKLAEMVRGFELSFPRDYSRLPEVANAVMAAVKAER